MGRQNRLEVHERQALAVRMKRDGRTLQEIADACGWRSPASAHKAIRAVLRRAENKAAAELRTMEDARLDAILARLNDELGVIRVGDDPVVVARLCTAIVRVSEARTRLHGLAQIDPAVDREPDPEAQARVERLKAQISQAFDDSEELRRLKAAAIPPAVQPNRPAESILEETSAVEEEPPAVALLAGAEPDVESTSEPPMRTRCIQCGSPLTVTTRLPTTCAGCQRGAW